MKSNKKLISTAAAIAISSSSLLAQGLNNKWDINGNTTTPGNFHGTVNNQPLNFRTNNIQRMIINNGGNGVGDGQIAIGNNLAPGFIPQSRLHIHQDNTNPFAGNNTYIRFTNNVTGSGPNSGFAIGNSNGFGGPFGDVQLLQYESAPIITKLPNGIPGYTGPQPYEWFRIENGKTFSVTPLSPPRYTDGYVGLNNSNPRAHIDMVTPAYQGGEEFFFAKPSDLTGADVQMGLMNLAAQAGYMNPGFFGNINQNNQWQSAMTTVGAIPIPQDIPANPPITRFISARDWKINQGNPAPTDISNIVVNRKLFSWQNADNVQMYMMSNGRLRIQNNAILGGGVITSQISNNRLEITAANFDPYFDPVGNPVGNPNFGGVNFGRASGLRFTFLTSRDNVQIPNATNEIDPTKVLTVDKNGDVVAINTIANGNNGVSNNNGTIQLGTSCAATTAQIAASQLQNNRQIPLNGFNVMFNGTSGGVGIGKPNNTCAPNNKLEVDNGVANPNTSGLRLTRLTSASPASPTSLSQNKVLAVDPNGDVILVNDQTGGTGTFAGAQNGLNNIMTIANPTGRVELGGNLLHNTIISMGDPSVPAPNTYNLSYVPLTSSAIQGNICIGKQHSTAPTRLEVYNGISGLSGIASGADISVDQTNYINYGAKVEATNATFRNFAVIANAGGGTENMAYYSSYGDVHFHATAGGGTTSFGTNPPSNTFSKVFIRPDGQAYALRIQNTAQTVNSFQIDGTTGQTIINAAISPSPNQAGSSLVVNGNIWANGTGYSSGGWLGSDNMLKTNVDTISNASLIIKNLKPKSYYFDTTNIYGMNFSSKKQYGFIAQDVETILPELVSSTKKEAELDTANNIVKPAVTFKTMNYNALFALLVKAMQEQQKTIDSLKNKTSKQDSINNAVQAQIAALTSSVSSCCSNSSVRTTKPEEVNQLTIDLSDKDIIVLNQNVPNPFAEQTTITYNVPEKYGYAQIIFNTIEGKIIKAVDITKKGRGQLNVFASDLSSGMYTYSLVVDGKIIDTKKMVKSE